MDEIAVTSANLTSEAVDFTMIITFFASRFRLLNQ